MTIHDRTEIDARLGRMASARLRPSVAGPISDEYSADGAQFGHQCERRISGAPQTARLIALTSPAMGSGKSVVAKHLCQAHGFVLVKFAGPLKNMVRTLLGDAGIPAADVERMVEGDLKEAPVGSLGTTPRRLMQTIGGEWARDCIHPDFWVRIARAAIQALLDTGTSVVVDDMRYPNELQMIRSLGGDCVQIVRPGVSVTAAHQSEGALNDISMLRVMNDGTLDDLRRQADTLATCPLR